MKEKIVFNTKKEVNRRTSVFKVGDIISIPSTLTDSEVSKKARKKTDDYLTALADENQCQ